MICLDANYLIGGRIVPFDSASAELAAGLFNLIGRPRARRVDVMIAAIAIQQDAQLATRSTLRLSWPMA